MNQIPETGPVFDAYAAYYDLLYKDKDYAGEAEYVHRLIQQYHPGAVSILELGSGTGRHARLLAEKGYVVHGVERSQEMLEKAVSEIAGGRPCVADKDAEPAQPSVSFSLGDLRTAEVDKKFDVVISLFHVISYLPENEDVQAAFANARRHLKKDGIFLFDVWYGPAVAAHPPSVRIKRMEDDAVRITRICEPKWKPNENRVDVHYQLLVGREGSRELKELKETHIMRYFFLPELSLFLSNAGFRLQVAESWMTGEAPSRDTWGVCCVCRTAS